MLHDLWLVLLLALGVAALLLVIVVQHGQHRDEVLALLKQLYEARREREQKAAPPMQPSTTVHPVIQNVVALRDAGIPITDDLVRAAQLVAAAHPDAAPKEQP